MVTKVTLLNKKSVRIRHGGTSFETPEELINFVNTFPERAEAMEKGGIIKITKSKSNGK